MKRMLSLCLSLVLLLSVCPVSSAVGNKEREVNEALANEYHTKMIVYFEQESGYPSHYGGAYVNDDGNLVICVTEDSQEIREEYYKVSGADELEFRQVKYSLIELYGIAKSANRYAEITGRIPKAETSLIIQRENRIEHCVSESALKDSSQLLYSGEKIYVNDFEYKDAVDFKVSGELVLEASAGGPGYELYRTVGGPLVGSIGYLAHRNNNGVEETGFVTAGHNFPWATSFRTAYNDNYEIIGECTYTNGIVSTEPDDYDDTDVAFVKLDSDATISSKVLGTSYYQDMSVQYTIPAEGSQIYKSGRVTGATPGHVYSLYYVNANNYMTGPRVRRILADYSSDHGDSGGIVYVLSGGKARVVGIHQASKSIDGTVYKIVISAYNIQDVHGIIAGN